MSNFKQPKKVKMKQPNTDKTTDLVQKEYQRGDVLQINNQDVVVVEVLENTRLHVKNSKAPFNSFIVLAEEINVSHDVLMKAFDDSVEEFGKERLAKALVTKDEFAPDLMLREDNRFTL